MKNMPQKQLNRSMIFWRKIESNFEKVCINTQEASKNGEMDAEVWSETGDAILRKTTENALKSAKVFLGITTVLEIEQMMHPPTRFQEIAETKDISQENPSKL